MTFKQAGHDCRVALQRGQAGLQVGLQLCHSAGQIGDLDHVPLALYCHVRAALVQQAQQGPVILCLDCSKHACMSNGLSSSVETQPCRHV